MIDSCFINDKLDSIEEAALREVLKAKATWLETAKAQAKLIPEPKYRSAIYQYVS